MTTTKHHLADSYLEAKTYGPIIAGGPKLLVVHTAETPEMGNSAEGVASYFHNGATRRVNGEIITVKASTTWAVDSNSIVQCVPLGHVNFAAPGANHIGEHMELAGRAAQTAKDWSDSYSLAELKLAAKLFGTRSAELGIPLVYLRAEDLLASQHPTGVTTHAEVTRAYKRSTHTDPGPNFPMSWFLAECATHKPFAPTAWALLGDRPKLLRLTKGYATPPLALFDGRYANDLPVVVWVKTIAQAQSILARGIPQTDWTMSVQWLGDVPS